MAPSIFSESYSRGPLYQYWKERSAEEKAMREQRITEAKLRSKGYQPMSATFGPSSNESYIQRATSGPPGYASATAGAGEGDQQGFEGILGVSERERNGPSSGSGGTVVDQLPSYNDAAGSTDAPFTTQPQPHLQPHQQPRLPTPPPEDDTSDGLLGAEAEKTRLAHLESQRRQIDEDAMIAQTLSRESASEVEVGSSSRQGVGEGEQHVQVAGMRHREDGIPHGTRRKSAGAKIGGWLAAAATGYTKKQERF